MESFSIPIYQTNIQIKVYTWKKNWKIEKHQKSKVFYKKIYTLDFNFRRNFNFKYSIV